MQIKHWFTSKVFKVYFSDEEQMVNKIGMEYHVELFKVEDGEYNIKIENVFGKELNGKEYGKIYNLIKNKINEVANRT